MSFAVSHQQGVAVISVRGPLHANLCAVVQDAVKTARFVLLDLTAADGVVATDGQVLLRAHQIVLGATGVFGIADPGPRVSLLLDLAGASKLIPVAPTVAAGAEMVKQRSVGMKQTTTAGIPAMEPESLEKQVETFVRLAARSQDHVKLLEAALASGTPLIVSKAMAKTLGCSSGSVDQILADFEAARIVKPLGGGKYQLEPSAVGRALVGALLKMWKQPPARKQVLAWIAESQKERPIGSGTTKIEKRGLFGRLRGE